MSRQRFPLNASGDFYVEDGMCIACSAPEHEAPDLMTHAIDREGHYHCYFKRQPQTQEELLRATTAVVVGCCGAVRYAGTDATVITRLVEAGVGDCCDART